MVREDLYVQCAGSVEVAADLAEELLQAADQYMLEPLKRLCEAAIAADLAGDTLALVYDLSENFNAPQLGRHCMLFALEHYEELVRSPALALHCLAMWPEQQDRRLDSMAQSPWFDDVTAWVPQWAALHAPTRSLEWAAAALTSWVPLQASHKDLDGFSALLRRMVPELKARLTEQLLKKQTASV